MYAQICIQVKLLIPYSTGEEFNKSMGVAVDLSSETLYNTNNTLHHDVAH